MKEEKVMLAFSDKGIHVFSEEASRKLFERRERKPIENKDEIIKSAREHLRKHGLSI